MFFFLLCLQDNLAFSLDRWLFASAVERYSFEKKKKKNDEKQKEKKFSFFLSFLSFFLFGERERGSRDRGTLCTHLGVALMRASVFFFPPFETDF